MSNEVLLANTKAAVDNEKSAIATVTRHLQEIFERRLYLPKYASMFEMLRDEYGYCAGSAQIRINAIRLIRDIPCVREKLETGEISMSVVSNIQSLLYSEKRAERPYSHNAKIELVETCIGKSVSEAQKEFARCNPEIEKWEVLRPISDDRLRVSHSISTKLEEKLQEIKTLWSHIGPDISREALLDRIADLTLAVCFRKDEASRSRSKSESRMCI